MQRMRIACVVQRYGLEVNGGAELLCRLVSERLASFCAVEVITTCAQDYLSWKNVYPAGASSLGGVVVRRFPVARPRDLSSFDKISARVLAGGHSLEDEKRWIEQQGPDCPQLLQYLASQRDHFDAFLFFTYLYATTCLGLPLVKERAILVPTAHDEPPIYLSVYDAVFRSARRIVFCTPEEREFVLRRFCLDEEVGEVAGVGAPSPPEPAEDPDWQQLQTRIGDAEILAYAGRIDPSKGCATMIDYMRRYLAGRPWANVKLLLLGNAAMPLPGEPFLIHAGFVSESTKWHVLRASRVVLLPSQYESLSLAVLEAWTAGSPVLVNGNCKVLRGQCMRSNGGLWYADYDEFAACLDRLLKNRRLCAALGRQGQAYVADHYNWHRVEQAYRRALEYAAHPCLRAATAQ